MRVNVGVKCGRVRRGNFFGRGDSGCVFYLDHVKVKRVSRQDFDKDRMTMPSIAFLNESTALASAGRIGSFPAGLTGRFR